MLDTSYLIAFFKWLNNDVFALPAAILFFGVSIILTIKTGFLQIRAFPRFLRLIFKGLSTTKYEKKSTSFGNAINPFHALFTALGTSIGVGNIVVPGIAITTGGPGALFWLVIYIFFASVTKFTEVMFALHTRTKNDRGDIVGGPMEYLKAVHPWLAYWYAAIMSALLIGFSAVQSNTLSSIYALEKIPAWTTGLVLAIITVLILSGGARRIGAVASKLVPFMFVLYVSFALFILLKDITALVNALKLIMNSILMPAAPLGGFLGASIFQAIHCGMIRGVFISESGIGTASIPHAMADVKHHIDQGILAMGSTIADILLSAISGLLILVTGIWMRGGLSNTLVYEVFKLYTPLAGQIILLVSISLFVLTTVIGNSFNGIQNFTSLSRGHWTKLYTSVLIFCLFLGSILPTPLVWEAMDTVLFLAAVPNLLGLLYLAFKYPTILKNC
ncbi:MAG: amino acid carrier protein [Candidatus Dependentiae bacterium]|nr:amino acid carrier protein [Candidatus Dependentiae bacterium]